MTSAIDLQPFPNVESSFSGLLPPVECQTYNDKNIQRLTLQGGHPFSLYSLSVIAVNFNRNKMASNGKRLALSLLAGGRVPFPLGPMQETYTLPHSRCNCAAFVVSQESLRGPGKEVPPKKAEPLRQSINPFGTEKNLKKERGHKYEKKVNRAAFGSGDVYGPDCPRIRGGDLHGNH